jgi:mannose-6-phosphate isomerase-like protein (cupin superfamily)
MTVDPGVTVTPWDRSDPPSLAACERILRDEGLSPPRPWSNGPHDVYGSHQHSYHKVLYCVQGSIRFRLDSEGRDIDLSPGDRLEIPPRTSHSAVVGPQGVMCVEASR